MFCSGPESRESKREARRQAILEAAQKLFMENGFEATTLSDVVRSSGGSLATLYEMFENKQGLLRALVTERCSRTSEAIERAVAAHHPPRQALAEITHHMFDKIIDPKSTAMLKAALNQPELGPQLYEAGPAAAQKLVAHYLAEQAELATLQVDDPAVASQVFFQLMFGHFHHQLLFGVPFELTPEQKAEHIDRVLTDFLKIYGNQPHS